MEHPFRDRKDIDWLAIQYLELGEEDFNAALVDHLPPEEAALALDRATSYLAFRRLHSHPCPLGGAYVLLAIDLQKAGHYGTARMCLERALPICEAAGDVRAVAKCHEGLGSIAFETKHFDEAETRYRRALGLSEQTHCETEAAIVHHQLGCIYEKRGDYERAESSLRSSIAIKTRLGNQAGICNSTFHLGKIAQRQGDYDLAEQCYRRCLSMDKELEDQQGITLDYPAHHRQAAHPRPGPREDPHRPHPSH